MRVLLVTPDYPPMSGGIQLLLHRLVTHSRHDFEIVTLNAPDGEASADPQTAVIRPPQVGSHRFAILELNAWALQRALTTRPEVVVSGHMVVGPAALVAARLLGVPAIQYLYSKELAVRPYLTRHVTRHAAASIAISAFTRQQTVALGAPDRRLHTIYPGVDPPAADTADVDPAPTRAPTLITVARLEDPYKGFDMLLAAMPLIRARIPDARWVLVGDGSMRPEIEGRARALSISDAVTLTGAVSDAERDGWLRRADVFAMPGRLMGGDGGGEGFGIAYLEAGAHGLPSVVGNVGGGAEAVVDGQTGLAVDPTDHVAIAEAVTRLLIDDGLRSRLGEGGRERAASFTWERMAASVDDLIDRAVQRRL
jgi:phosphatidylinositol alpha-1,6-mannosyltransferase